MPSRRKDEGNHKRHVIVIGGGVIGLSVGWRAAKAGMRVTVFEAAVVGSGATGAAAGMLAARVESSGDRSPLLDIMLRSRRLWPSFARAVEKASGMDIGYRRYGTLMTAFNHDEKEKLIGTFPPRADGELRHISPQEAYRMEDSLAPGLLAGVFSPDDHCVDGRRLAQALKKALIAAGGVCHEHRSVRAITRDGARCAVTVNDGRMTGDAIVLAAGAWSGKVDGIRPGLLGRIRPVKGQVIALASPRSSLIKRVIWGYDCYLVPHRDGRILIGATVEETGYDASVTVDGVYRLLDRARRILPGIDPCPIRDIWGGLRPTGDDGLPLLGHLSRDAYPGLIVATGHYRNGILLAPETARIILDCLRGGDLAEADAIFAADRFSGQAGHQGDSGGDNGGL